MDTWNGEVFKIHNYTKNGKDRISTCNLQGQALIWWEHLIAVRKVRERKMDLQ